MIRLQEVAHMGTAFEKCYVPTSLSRRRIRDPDFNTRPVIICVPHAVPRALVRSIRPFLLTELRSSPAFASHLPDRQIYFCCR